MSSETPHLPDRIRKGGAEKYHTKLATVGKLFVRKRIELLLDEGSFVEDGLYANCLDEKLPADGVITGLGKISGRPVALMANDSTVKAGSWGQRTVEKIIRIQETAGNLNVPLFYLVDSAGARITDQVDMFPGRRGAGRIFYNQSKLSGKIPQICLLFGPSPAGGAYIPAFCDVVFMVEGNASMYLGSPRMVESVIGEKISLEDLGGARMHCSVSGCGDLLLKKEEEAIEKGKRYFSLIPQNSLSGPETTKLERPEFGSDVIEKTIPNSPLRAYDMKQILRAIIDMGSFFELKPDFAPEVITGFARLGGRAVGVIANQTLVKGGVLFVDSADKAARFIQLCDTYRTPILFLADVPGFMVGSKVERAGIIRAGAKMIYAVSRATVPKVSVIVRKAYGAGLYAMSGPAFETDCVLALPSAKIAVMGPEPAINAVYFNKMEEMKPEDRKAFVAEKIAEYEKNVDIHRLASELIVDHIVSYKGLRSELIQRFEYYSSKSTKSGAGVYPM